MADDLTTDAPFTLSLDQEAIDYDPFDVIEDEDDEDVDYDIDEDSPGSVDGREVDRNPVPAKRVDTRTPEQKVADLFSRMRTRKRVLYGILAFCSEPKLVSDVNSHIEFLEENDASVFPAAKYCEHLQSAGALLCVTADGTPYGEAEVEPERVFVDGVEYLRAAEPAEAYWVASPLGRQTLEANRPDERIDRLFEDSPQFLPIYKYVLEKCAGENGATVTELGEIIDDHPLVQTPRRYAQYFLDQLDKVEAIVWKKGWFITDLGAKRLSEMEGIAPFEAEATLASGDSADEC